MLARVATLALALLAVACIKTQATASPLTSKDVRTLISALGMNPGTVRNLDPKGLHQLLRVWVTGKKGHFVVHLVEREVR